MTTRQVENPAARKELVTVTAELIEKSKTANSAHCMIAEAVRACIPGATKISVDLQAIRFSDKRTGWRYAAFTPRWAQKAILDFDDGKTPAPFKFWFRPAQVTEMEGHKAPEGVLKSKRGRDQKLKRIVSNAQETIPFADDITTNEPVPDKELATIGVLGSGTKTMPLAQGSQQRASRKGLDAQGKHRSKAGSGTRREFGIRAFRTGHNI